MTKKLVMSIVIFILLISSSIVIANPYSFSSYQYISLKSLSEYLNNPPENVSIDGPISGRAGTLYEYSFYCDDPEGDDVNYYIKWGTPSCPVVYGPYPSSSQAIIGYSWGTMTIYNITVKAVDVYGAESDIVSLIVAMPFYISLHRIIFQIIQNWLVI